MSYPNQLTVFRIILTPLFAVLLTFEDVYFKYFSLFVFVVAAFTDWYDGYVARKYGNITSTGIYLDPLADKLLISTAFGMFTYLGYVKLWMFVAIALRDILITGLRSYAISKKRPLATKNIAKWKTAFQMGAIYLIFIWMLMKESYAGLENAPAYLVTFENWDLIGNLMLFVTVFTVATGVSYIIENWNYIKSMAIAFYRVFVPTNVR